MNEADSSHQIADPTLITKTVGRLMHPKSSKGLLPQMSRSDVLKRNFHRAILALVMVGFALVAAQRLGTVPLPDSDESMMLQISYEILHRGKLAFPMKSFYGGNIENAWHSLTPVAFATLSGFMKTFGWGLLQGRAFNLIAALLVLLMTYILAQKLFGRNVGLIAIVLMISDPVFLARSRLVRYDMIAAAFALLAFYLYEKAEERNAGWYYVASGLAAGAGVMCHTNVLYMLCVVGVLMLLRHGWRILRTRPPYLFAAGALTAMAYEIAFAIVDYKNFALQTRKDDVHFGILEPLGWLHNLVAEPARYADWFDARGARIAPHLILLHVFLSLTIAAILYLAGHSLIQIKRRTAMADPHVRLLVTTLIIALFFAIVTQRKVIQYVVHLTPWFALCGAVLLSDAVAEIRKLRHARWRWAKPAYVAVMVLIIAVVSAYGRELVLQNKSYLAQVRNPDQPGFEEIKAALRSIVPDGVCPVSIASGYLWLAFPEHDQCYFAYMEAPLDRSLQLDGKEYALIVKPKFEDRLVKLTGAGFEQYHLLGELKNTAYGTFLVYYTGDDPHVLSRSAQRYYFFGHQRGYASDAQVAAAREVWSADGGDLHLGEPGSLALIEPDDPDEQQSGTARGNLMNLSSVDLHPNTIYQLDARSRGDYELLVLDDRTSVVIQRLRPDRAEPDRVEGLFKTSTGNRIRLALRLSGAQPADASPISHISIRAVAPA